MRQLSSIILLRRKILSWYRKNKRDLPWRHTRDPYAILVSEVMLQQTQVLRVLPKYAEFIEAYPTVDALANSSLADVLRLWSGLGYNRRAKYLRQLAQMVQRDYRGKMPKTYGTLRKLPGIGDYTANAVLCFAFRKKAPAVDTNVRNVIEHECNQDKPLSLTEIKKLLTNLMPDDHPDEFLHALMDYSSILLKRPIRNVGKSSGIPFKQTNRFLRGYIMKVLTTKRFTRPRLIRMIQEETGRSSDDIKRALGELLTENLVRDSRGLLTL